MAGLGSRSVTDRADVGHSLLQGCALISIPIDISSGESSVGHGCPAGESCSRRPIRAVVGFGLMVGFTIVVFLLIRSYGEGLVAPPRAKSSPSRRRPRK
jgi:hypothetical protein